MEVPRYAPPRAIAATRKLVTAKTTCIRDGGSGILYCDDPTSPEGGAPMIQFDTKLRTVSGGADLGVAPGGPSGTDRCA